MMARKTAVCVCVCVCVWKSDMIRARTLRNQILLTITRNRQSSVLGKEMFGKSSLFDHLCLSITKLLLLFCVCVQFRSIYSWSKYIKKKKFRVVCLFFWVFLQVVFFFVNNKNRLVKPEKAKAKEKDDEEKVKYNNRS